MIIMAAQLANPNVILRNSFFSIFGKYSYGIYLCHIFIIRAIDSIPVGENLKKIGLLGSLGKYLTICGASLATAVCVEKAYRKIIKHVSNMKGVS